MNLYTPEHVTVTDDKCWQCGEPVPPAYLVGVKGPVTTICGHCTQINRRACEDYDAERITMSRAAEKVGLSVYQFKFDVWVPWLEANGKPPVEQEQRHDV